MSALISLVSKGVQDAYITGDPQVSFFRQNYKRHTNFSLKPERIDYIGTFTGNSEVSIPIKSKGDLLTYIWIEADAIGSVEENSNGFFSSNTTPSEFTLMIGGQQVVTMDSLFVQGVHNVLYNETQAQSSTAITTNKASENAKGGTGVGDSYVIPFFFTQDWTKALPLAALQFHEVEVRVKCRPGLLVGSTPKVYAMYAYLDTDERKFLTEQPHEILITQVQHQPASSNLDTEFDLTYFNHPVKAIHYVSGQQGDYSSSWDASFTFNDSSLYINGTALFEGTTPEFHHTVVPKMHCQALPDGCLNAAPVFTWPFCLNLAKSQPTGSINFSRLDTAKLTFSRPQYGSTINNRVYAVNYNILRIKNGMAGVAFSN